MKKISMILFFLMLCYSSAFSKANWGYAEFIFNDNSTIVGQTNITLGRIIVIYENEKLEVPVKDIKSIEIVEVSKSYEKSSHGYYNRAIHKIRLITKAGIDSELIALSIPAIFILSKNPLTNKSMRKRYWLLGEKKLNNMDVYDEENEFKKIVKIRFRNSFK